MVSRTRVELGSVAAGFDFGGMRVEPFLEVGVTITVVAVGVVGDLQLASILFEFRPAADVFLALKNAPRAVTNRLDHAGIHGGPVGS